MSSLHACTCGLAWLFAVSFIASYHSLNVHCSHLRSSLFSIMCTCAMSFSFVTGTAALHWCALAGCHEPKHECSMFQQRAVMTNVRSQKHHQNRSSMPTPCTTTPATFLSPICNPPPCNVYIAHLLGSTRKNIKAVTEQRAAHSSLPDGIARWNVRVHTLVISFCGGRLTSSSYASLGMTAGFFIRWAVLNILLCIPGQDCRSFSITWA